MHFLEELFAQRGPTSTTPFGGAHAYISRFLDKGVEIGWVVTLPKGITGGPRQKYFKYTAYPSEQETLTAAMTYRDLRMQAALYKMVSDSKTTGL